MKKCLLFSSEQINDDFTCPSNQPFCDTAQTATSWMVKETSNPSKNNTCFQNNDFFKSKILRFQETYL
jgi:hypothetical protein